MQQDYIVLPCNCNSVTTTQRAVADRVLQLILFYIDLTVYSGSLIRITLAPSAILPKTVD